MISYQAHVVHYLMIQLQDMVQYVSHGHILLIDNSTFFLTDPD